MKFLRYHTLQCRSFAFLACRFSVLKKGLGTRLYGRRKDGRSPSSVAGVHAQWKIFERTTAGLPHSYRWCPPGEGRWPNQYSHCNEGTTHVWLLIKYFTPCFLSIPAHRVSTLLSVINGGCSSVASQDLQVHTCRGGGAWGRTEFAPTYTVVTPVTKPLHSVHCIFLYQFACSIQNQNVSSHMHSSLPIKLKS